MDMYVSFSNQSSQPQLAVQTLNLKQYRNIQEVQLNCEQAVHFFVGPNAQGKTNLLESLYVVALGKSHRTRSHTELIQFGQSLAKVEATIKRQGHQERLAVLISSQGKKVTKNGIEQKKLSQYIGTLPAIMFAPEDLALVKGSPGVRRRFLDMEIGQVSPAYLYDLSRYNKLIQQRNRLLKQAPHQLNELLDVLNEQMTPIIVNIWKKRLFFLKELNKWAQMTHQAITQQKEALTLHYQATFPLHEHMSSSELTSLLQAELERIREKEISRRVTLIGPHRDDVRLRLDEMDVNTFGSQGQQRTVALSLKLAEIELIYHTMGVYPILLLDDVLSELDDHRKTHLFQAIEGRVQTFVTTTSLDGIDTAVIQRAKVYQVHQGTILKQG